MRKRLSWFNGLPPYPGGKRRLVPWIFANLSKHVPDEEWSKLTFLDAFLGGGAVSLFAKAQGFASIACNDWSYRSQVVGQALLLNQNRMLEQADQICIANSPASGIFRAEFTPHTFSSRHAEMLDQIHQAAQASEDLTQKALYQLLLWHLAGDFVCFGSSIGSSNRPYAEALDGLRAWDSLPTKRYLDHSLHSLLQPTWHLVEKRARAINQSVFGGSPVQLFQQDAIEFVRQTPGDILYLDPPYAQTVRYEAAFKTIDRLLSGKPQANPPSGFSESTELLDAVFESAQQIPIWLLSYGDKTVSLEELKARIQAHRPHARITAHARQYTHMAHVSYNRSHQELLIIASPK